MNQLGPVQFNIQRHWFQHRRELLGKEPIQEALGKLLQSSFDYAEMRLEDESILTDEEKHEEYELELHTARVKIKDLHWLLEKFDNIDLYGLALAIAQDAMPEKIWEIVEAGEEAVVTDLERSIVFDMKRGCEMTAGASLVIVEDKKYQPTRAALEEVKKWYEDRAALEKWRLEKMRAHIAQHDHPGVVVELPASRPE